MKKINIIDSLSPQQQYALQRWFYMSIVISLALLSIGVYCIVPKFLLYISLQKDIQLMQNQIGHYATHVNEKESLKKEYDEWRMRQTKIDVYRHQLKNPYAHIAYIIAQCKDDVQLESIRFNKKEIEIVVHCKTSVQANTYVKQLNESEFFSQVKMISLQHDDSKNRLVCIMKAYVIF